MSRLAGEWSYGRVLRLNLWSKTNKDYAEKMDVQRTPTFILFDGKGREIKRYLQSVPQADELTAAVHRGV